MPAYLYRPMARGPSTLIHQESKVNQGNAQLTSSGAGATSATMPERVAQDVSKKLGLSGAIQDKIGKLKLNDKEAKKKKLKENKPIVFNI